MSGELEATAARFAVPEPRPMTGADRITRVLEYLARADDPPTHGDLVVALGIARSTLSDTLAELRALGYVRVVERRYVLGPALLSLAHRVVRRTDILDVTRPILENLARQTGETCVVSLEIMNEGLIVPVDQAAGSNRIHFHAHLGEPWPMHFTGAGQALLAFSERTIASLPPIDAEDVPAGFELATLEQELREVRRRGFALEVGTQDGYWSIAAPVRDATGWPLAAISVVGPTERLRRSQAQVCRVLVDATDRWRVPLGRVRRRGSDRLGDARTDR